jgi:hypothetical protein
MRVLTIRGVAGVVSSAALLAAAVLEAPIANAGPYRSCDEAEAAGAAPMYVGDADYSSNLDRDGDGVACELSSSSGGGYAPAPVVVPALPAPGLAPPVTFADVPQMISGAVLGGPCMNFERYIFGKDANGETLACVAFGGTEGQWVASAPLQGVQQIGTACTNASGGGAAQSPDGTPLVCVDGHGGPGSGWQPGP